MKCYEIRLADMSTTVVYAKTEEALTYMTAVNARLLTGNKKG